MTVGLISFASPPSIFNGGKSQLVLNGAGTFANVLLSAPDWGYNNNNNGLYSFGNPIPSLRDANGMVNSIPSGNGVRVNVTIPGSAARPGNWVMRATGTGVVSITSTPATGTFSGYIASGILNIVGSVTGSIGIAQALVGSGVTAGTRIGSQLTATTYQLTNYLGVVPPQTLGSFGSPVSMSTSNGSGTVSGIGRQVIYPGDSGGDQVLTANLNGPVNSSAYITSIALVHADDELAWVADPLAYNPLFVNKLKAGGSGVLRDLNFSDGNNSMVTTWATRKPFTYWSMGAQEIRQSLFCSSGAVHSSGSVLAISSISFSGGLATVVTSTAHGQTGSFPVSIDGCVTTSSSSSPLFNGTFTATVVDTVTFTYPLAYTPVTPTILGTANIGVFDYAMTFTDPVYGSGAPVDKQTILFYFDALGNVAQNTAAAFQSNACLWTGHPFVGGEMVGFTKGDNLPNAVGAGSIYYVLSAGLVAGVSFQFSATAGGSPVTFSASNIGTFTGTLAAGVLTVSGYSGSTMRVGSVINGTSVNANTVITSFGTGSGGNGTYNVTGSQSIGPIAMSSTGIVKVARLPTLTLNGSGGAFPFVGPGVVPLFASSTYAGGQSSYGSVPSPRLIGAQPSLAVAIFDADIGAWILSGGNLTSGSALNNAAPPELFLKLCKIVGAHPWHAIPGYTLDPATDYAVNLATLDKATASWMIPRAEPANEIWNFAQPVSSYACAKAFDHWNAQFTNGNFDYANWYGKVASTLGQDYNKIYGSSSHASVGNGYIVAIGVQIDTFSSVGSNGNGARFASTNYVSQSQSAQSGYLKEAASVWGTHAHGANYIQPSNTAYDPTVFNANYARVLGSATAGILTVTSLFNGQATIGTIVAGQTISDRYGQIPAGVTILAFGTGGTTGVGGTGTYALSNSSFTALANTIIVAQNATAQTEVAAFVATFGGAASNDNLAYALLRFTNLLNYAVTLTNGAGNPLGTSAYEGGYGITFPGTSSNLFEAAKFTNDFALCVVTGGTLSGGSTVTGNYAALASLGVIFPSQYQLTGAQSPWCIIPDIYSTTPTFSAIAAFN